METTAVHLRDKQKKTEKLMHVGNYCVFFKVRKHNAVVKATTKKIKLEKW